MTRKPLNSLQAGRAFAALAVLLFHANDTLQLQKYLGHPVAPLLQGGNSGVQFFFVLSGFVILLAHHKDLGRPRILGIFLWKRFRRIYPPLWAALLLITPVYLLVPSFGKGGERSVATVISAFLLTPVRQEFLLSPEWTLRHELIFYVIFALCIWNKRIGCMIVVVWLALSAALPMLGSGYPWAFFFTPNHLLFGMGALACLGYLRDWVSRRMAALLASLGAATFLTAWIVRIHAPTSRINSLDLLFGIGATLLISGCVAIEREGRLPVPRVFVFLGEASYSIYLAHYPALSVGSKVCLQLHQRLPDLAILAIITMLALVAGILFHVAVEKPLMARVRVHRGRPELTPA